jgi:DNA-binding Lrp family transcriptional regulator
MQEPSSPDQTDLELVNALQIHPRATWQLLGSVLGLDPATVGRRWARLVEGGWSWICTSPTPGLADSLCSAVVEVDCRPGRAREVADELARDPRAFTIDHVAGSGDLIVGVDTEDLAAMSEFVDGRLGRMPGVSGIRCHFVTGLLAEAGGWRLDLLDPAQQSRLRRARTVVRTRGRTLSPTDRAIVAALHTDGRVGNASLARRLSTSPATVRRRVEALTASGCLVLRCELARATAGWPVTAVYWCSAPALALARIGDRLRQRPETRTCVALAGPRNVLLVSCLHSVADVRRLECELNETVPELLVHDRSIAYRTIKLYGHILDDHGRRVATVPVSAG